MGFLSVGAACKQQKWALESMQKTQKVLEGCAHRIKGNAGRQVPQQGEPQWGGRPGQQHENAGPHCPSRPRGRFESDFDGWAWFRSFPLVMGMGRSNQDIFNKMKGEEVWCWGYGGKMSFALPFPSCHWFPSVFDECSIRCYAVFHQYIQLTFNIVCLIKSSILMNLVCFP